MTAARITAVVRARGETVTVRRITGTTSQTFTEATVKARIGGYDPSELAGNVKQGDSRCFIGTQDLIAEGFPVPVRQNDKVIRAGGKTLNVEGHDPRKWSDDEALTVLQLRG